jgi:hypothetical protein
MIFIDVLTQNLIDCGLKIPTVRIEERILPSVGGVTNIPICTVTKLSRRFRCSQEQELIAAALHHTDG